MIRAILKKDWILLWPLVLLVTAIQVALEWSQYSGGLLQESAVAGELQRPLTLAWFLAIAALTVAAVQQDAIPGADQDWLIRPIKRGALLCAKLLFVLLSICVPMFLLNLSHALLLGFSLGAALQALAFKELYVFAVLLAPLLALASTTRNMSELALLAAAMVVLYALGSGLSAVLGPGRCPTCDSGLSWQTHLLQHAGVLCGSALMLYWQYRRRATGAARAVALTGAALVVFTQMPWDLAFSLQRSLTQTMLADAAPLSLAAVAPAAGTANLTVAANPNGARPETRGAARALLHGDVDPAAVLLHRRLHGTRLLNWDAEIRVVGMAREQLLLIDRTEVVVEDAAGRAWFHGADTQQPLIMLDRPDGSAAFSMRRDLPVPLAAWQDGHPDYARLRVNYWLTRMQPIGSYRMAAGDGQLRASRLGVCESKLGRDAIDVRCQQIGSAPFCLSATLVGPEVSAGRPATDESSGEPPAIECAPDYRPYAAVFANALSYAGVDVALPSKPDAGLLSRSYLLLTAYAVLDHSRSTLNLAAMARQN